MNQTIGCMTMKITAFHKQFKDHRVEMNTIESNQRIVVLKGINGSGKSTILKAIKQLISHKGTIECEGTISYMNESIMFPKDMTVMEILNAFRILDNATEERIYSLIDRFELRSKKTEKISALSKGMKMKLQLVCTFLIDRDLYLLDEPFSGLDQSSIDTLIDYINKSDKRFIITSHIDVSFESKWDVIQL